MARQLKEIKHFNGGTVSNVDPRETPDNSPILSYNIDSNAPAGVLRASKIDRLKGNHADHSQLKVDTALDIDNAGASINDSQTEIPINGIADLLENDYIVIDDEVMIVTSVENILNGSIVVTRAQFSTTATSHADETDIYRMINPIEVVTYSSEDGEGKENVVIFSENGHVDGVYDWNTTLFEEDVDSETSGITDTRINSVGAGINTSIDDTDLKQDFSSFPTRFRHNNNLSITKRNNSFHIGAGSGNSAKWLGRIVNANISGVSGFVLEDDELKNPLSGTDSIDYDKMITYQHSFSEGGTISTNAVLGNDSKVFHIGMKIGSNYLVAIDGDTGQAHVSASLPFTVHNICKCVSSKTKAKLWIYSKHKDDDVNIETMGKITLVTIFDIAGRADASIVTGDNGFFDQGNGWDVTVDKEININLAPEDSVPKSSDGNSKNYGYDSLPRYTKGSKNGAAYTGGQQISDILETVDSSGIGRLWLLASPLDTDDEDPANKWFRITSYARPSGNNSDYCCFRFLWASYERYNDSGIMQEIKGETMDGGGVIDIYFNDKSFSMIQMKEHAEGDTNSHRRQSLLCHDWGNSRIYCRTMKRQVPTISATTYSSNGEYIGTSTNTSDYKRQAYLSTAITTPTPDVDTPTIQKEGYHVLVNGGGSWYADGRNPNGTGVTPSGSSNTLGYSVISPEGGNWAERKQVVKGSGVRPSWYNTHHSDVVSSVIFKPIPNSLVDLSDLYPVPNGTDADTNLSHIVGCYVNFESGYFLEDAWCVVRRTSQFDTADDSVSANDKSHWGRRIRQASGASCLWISSGNLENYGAYYVRNNGFGYKETGTDTFPDIVGDSVTNVDCLPLSTLCCDLDASGDGATVRIMKWFPFQFPNRFTASIRNKSMTEFNGLNDVNDSDPRYSALFASYDTDDEELETQHFGNVTKLNTTTELVDKCTVLVDAGAAAAGTLANGLCGYMPGTMTNTEYVRNRIAQTGGDTSMENSPGNVNPVFQANGTQDFYALNEKSLTVEKETTGKEVNDIIPNGPGQVAFFGKTSIDEDKTLHNFLYKVDFNGSTSSTLHNMMGLNGSGIGGGTINDNFPMFLTSNCSQSIYMGNNGPFETTTGSGTYNTRNSADNADLPWGHTKTFQLNSYHSEALATSSFGALSEEQDPSAEGVDSLMIGHVWAQGQAAGNTADSTSVAANAATEYSRYNTASYRLSIFNRSGTKSAFYCDLTDEPIDFTPLFTNNFSSAAITGNFAHKLAIYAKTKHQKASTLVDIKFTGIETTLPAGVEAGAYDNYFPKQTFRWYKISFEYDGFQDSPLTNVDYIYYDEDDDYASIDVEIIIPPEVPPRATRLALWRRNEAGTFYKLIKSIRLDSINWKPGKLSGKDILTKTVRDRGFDSQGEDYQVRAGISQFIKNTSVNYGLSAKMNDYLFVADVSHVDISERGKSTIIRSQRGRFSQFDVNSNKMTLSEDVKALMGFNGRLYVFTNNSIIRINPETFVEEDVLDGYGCTHKDAVVVTEYGMYFADKNHIYHHDGTTAKILSNPIDSDDFSGKSISWSDMASTGTFKALFMPKTNQVGFAVDYLDSTSTYTNTYIWSYNILKQRWDLKKLFQQSLSVYGKASNLTFFNTLSDGSMYTFSNPLNLEDHNFCMVWELESGTTDGYQWFSKKFSMDQDTIVKRFIKIKVEADGLIDTPVVEIDGSPVTITSVGISSGAGTYEYKIAGANKKGKTIQIKWGDGTVDGTDDVTNVGRTIFSIGIIYRLGKIK